MVVSFKHLNEYTMTELPDGRWVPSIPMPLERGALFRHRYSCGCGKNFKTEDEYNYHYRTEQLLEMNAAMADTRDLWHEKALFWRRVAYVYRHFDNEDDIDRMKKEFDEIGWDELKAFPEIMHLNEKLMPYWQPLYQRYGSDRPLDVDEPTAEDQTADEAKGDFAEPFTVVNSKGVTYYLNMKEVSLRGGQMVPIWFFSRDFRPETGQRSLPEGYSIRENPRNGFLTVSKQVASDPGHIG